MTTPDINILYIALGTVLLLVGWRLFWIFVGAAGFVAGFDFAQYFFVGQSQIFILIAAICCALLGIFLAIIFQEVMFVLAGAVAGGTMSVHMLAFFVPYDSSSPASAIAFIVGAVLGAILMIWGINLAIIIISSLLGALLVASAIPIYGFMKLMLVVLLMSVGIFIQSTFLKGDPKAS